MRMYVQMVQCGTCITINFDYNHKIMPGCVTAVSFAIQVWIDWVDQVAW